MIDSTDGDEAGAALREFEEELGVPRARVTIVARLPDVITPIGPVTVTPFVGIVRAPFELRVDPAEPQSVHEVPLADLYTPGAVHEGIERVDRYDVHTWLFDRDGMHVWGATGRMLHHLLERYPDVALVPLAAAAPPVGAATRGSAAIATES